MEHNLPILDSHIHLDPNGDPVGSVKRFLSKGGTHLMVIHKPYNDIKIKDINSYVRSFEITVKMCRLANVEGARSWCFVGPYPGELPYLARAIGLEKATELQLRALDEAFKIVKKGEALGIGEIGRVHFPVDKEVQNTCDLILEKAFQGARDLKCPVVLHTESFFSNPRLMEHIAHIADEAGLPRHRVIKHYSGPDLIPQNINLGLSLSLQARRDTLKMLLSTSEDHLLETDYIDDPERPNVVMPPDTIPKKIRWAYDKGILDEKRHKRLMIDLPSKIFDVDMEI